MKLLTNIINIILVISILLGAILVAKYYIEQYARMQYENGYKDGISQQFCQKCEMYKKKIQLLIKQKEMKK